MANNATSSKYSLTGAAGQKPGNAAAAVNMAEFKRFRRFAWSVLLPATSALAACSSAPEMSREAAGASDEALSASTTTLWYEGSCAKLACISKWSVPSTAGAFEAFYCARPAGHLPNGNARPAGYYQSHLGCGGGAQICADYPYLVAPSMSACNTWYTICYKGKQLSTAVEDAPSDKGVWEASPAVFTQLGMPAGNTVVSIYPQYDPRIGSDPNCSPTSGGGGGGGGGGGEGSCGAPNLELCPDGLCAYVGCCPM